MLTDAVRDRLRVKQDFLLMLAIDMQGMDETRILCEGGPTLGQLRRYIYPEREISIDSALHHMSAESKVVLPNFDVLAGGSHGRQ